MFGRDDRWRKVKPFEGVRCSRAMTQHTIADRGRPAGVDDTRTKACGGAAVLENFQRHQGGIFRILNKAADV